VVERAGLCSTIDMPTILRQAPALSAAANGEERAEQIKNIQDRVARIRGAQNMNARTAESTREFVRRDRARRAAHPRTEVA
jgi:hypothetical protein